MPAGLLSGAGAFDDKDRNPVEGVDAGAIEVLGETTAARASPALGDIVFRIPFFEQEQAIIYLS